MPGIPLYTPQLDITGAIGLSASNQLLLEQHEAICEPAARAKTLLLDSEDAKDSKQAVTTLKSTSTATAAAGTVASLAGGNPHAFFAVDAKSSVAIPVNNITLKATPKSPPPPEPQFLSNALVKK